LSVMESIYYNWCCMYSFCCQ